MAAGVPRSGRVGSGKKGVRIDICVYSFCGEKKGRKGKEMEKEKEKKEKGGGLTTLFCFAYGMVEGRIDVVFFSAWISPGRRYRCGLFVVE